MMAILGVLFAVVYMAVFYGGTAISVALTPLGLSAFGFELIYGVWFMAATIAAYIIRKPGAALITEVLASAIELLMGNSGGATVVLTGLIQGVGCELGFAVFRYRKYNLLSMALSGVFAAVCIFCYELYYLSYYLLAPAMLAIKSIPVASFIILALILFSSRNLAVPISFLIVLPVLYSNVLGGIRAADSQLMEMARVFRIPVGRSIRYVYLPQVMPYFLSACGSALGLCWKSGIAAEVIGMPEGSIGEQLQQAKVYLDTPDLFAWTLVIVLVSLAFERAFLALLRRGARAMERM